MGVYMHILYVDESGDDGFNKNNSYSLNHTPTGCYIRTGLAIHDWKWHLINQKIEELKYSKKIPKNVELHATNILSGRDRIYIGGKTKYVPNWFGLNFPKKDDRYNIIIEICNLISTLELSLFYIIIDKAKIKTTVFNYKNLPKLRSWEF
jgi:hypothetical protein